MGFIVNITKSDLTPSTNLVFIGGRFLTHQNLVQLPPKRIESLIKVVLTFHVGQYKSGRTWLSLLGIFLATFPVVKWARLRARPIQLYFLKMWYNSLPPSHHIVVPFHLRNDLKWWTSKENPSQGFPLSHQHHMNVTDASGTGWVGVLDYYLSIKGKGKLSQ